MHFLWYLWINYFWASDKGNGPEALTQIAVGVVIGAIFWPPMRRWFGKKEQLIHAKLDHVIKHHPDIPEFKDPNAK